MEIVTVAALKKLIENLPDDTVLVTEDSSMGSPPSHPYVTKVVYDADGSVNAQGNFVPDAAEARAEVLKRIKRIKPAGVAAEGGGE